MAWIRTSLGGMAVLVLLTKASSARADCYVDGQNGNDSNDGQSEAAAVKSQAAIPSGCSVIRYRRGSVFNEPLKTPGFGSSSSVTFTNYGDTSQPLPAFDVTGATSTTATQSVVSSYGGGITVDGLHIKGSHGDGTMSGLTRGVCVTLGGNSKLLNSEIDACDIGIMLSGSGSLIQGNFVHDLRMAVDAADAGGNVNSVGGAEGIFISGSNNEVAYNEFINCTATAAWTGGSCDGGATEVTVGSSGSVSGLKIHHNFSYNSCGFFEVSSQGQGTFSDSEFYYNVAVDSGWMFLLQLDNTTLSNIKWQNNTIVQHSGSTNAGFVSMLYPQGSTLASGSIIFDNNLVILDGVTSFGTLLDAAISQTSNLIARLPADPDPGVVNVKGTRPSDYDLIASSPARDQGGTIPGYTLDFLNRTVPDSGGKTDIGAFEYGSAQGAELPTTPNDGTGGAATEGTGTGAGSSTPANGGASAAAPGGLGVSDSTGGCGCSIPRGRSAAWWQLGAVGLAIVFGRRRKASH